ncbi:spore coat protein [Paenibacillus urinalis]|uniref:Spore coat protein n=1 Tax=Paenibacillus urinalis TaxID=521520 RepID=A0ABY7XG72_9BACL|nr:MULTISPECIES: spore coat protein [Paenibacillus]WDH96365.1 spore coat protein [Paenibacillus urinalis]WDI04588.1 spore coat protein [Paenibacillus urinalis]GAK42822.1 Coat F domain-containing protein [Paenibacillus sp. TCA20]
MQFQPNHQNMQTGAVSPQMNHGGHEMFDVHEVLAGAVTTLNTYTILSQHVQDPELRDIMQRQKQFMADEYNTTLECFKSGQDPSMPTQSYKMHQGNDFTYGVQPTQPNKPIQSAAEINDEVISCSMLHSVKSGATAKTMAALESTNPVVRRVLADSVPNCIEMAYEISLYQNKHGYYQVPQLTQQDMTQMQNGYAPAQTQTPMGGTTSFH